MRKVAASIIIPVFILVNVAFAEAEPGPNDRVFFVTDSSQFWYWAESIAIFVGVATLVAGVWNTIRSNRESIKSQHLQLILNLSESFMQRWESGWSDTLDHLGASHVSPRTEAIPAEYVKEVRYMLNWVDWLGALKTSGVLDDLDVLTQSIGIPTKRIINCGYPILKSDTEKFGKDYWQNLLTIADDLNLAHVCGLRDSAS